MLKYVIEIQKTEDDLNSFNKIKKEKMEVLRLLTIKPWAYWDFLMSSLLRMEESFGILTELRRQMIF